MGDRGIIESNPIIARKYREMKKKIHLRKMRNMKSSLDTSLPRGLNALMGEREGCPRPGWRAPSALASGRSANV